MKYNIPNNIPNISGKEIAYVKRALTTGMLTDGEYIKEFEKKVAVTQGRFYGVGVSSGTAAIHLALLASGIKKGHEVITSATTFAATANAIIYTGAKPIFVDVNSSDLCLNIDELAKWLSTNTKMKDGNCINLKTKRRISAILLVHPYGFFSDRNKIYKLVKLKNIKIIEDGAEALGSSILNKPIARGSSIFTLSFNGNKIITSGGGGMVLCSNKKIANRIRYLANQAKASHYDFIHNDVGYNYRLSNISAAIGLAQLEKLQEFVKIKRNIFTQYKRFFDNKNIGYMIQEDKNMECNYWVSLLRFDETKKINIFELIKNMNKIGIQLRPIWKPLSLNRAFKCYETTSKLNISRKMYLNTIGLPSSTNISSKEIKIVCDKIMYFLTN